MPIQSSGPVSLSDLQGEFGGSSPISLGEYYRNGSYVTSNNTSIPTSGTIALGDFYGTVAQHVFTITNSIQEADLRSLATADGWNGSDHLRVVINSGVYLWSDSITAGGLIIAGAFPAGILLQNSGFIIGRGGDGGGFDSASWPSAEDGGPALQITSAVTVDVSNNSGAYIAGGGGGGSGGHTYGAGGGGGAGGGSGGQSYRGSATIGIGGAIGQSGTNAGNDSDAGGGKGGGSGGSGGGHDNGSGVFNDPDNGPGGGGGRILPGVGGTTSTGSSDYEGGLGGSGGNAGQDAPGFGAGGGGGGWGASGGDSGTRTGGAGGAAIEKVSGSTANLTNNGTVYGAT